MSNFIELALVRALDEEAGIEELVTSKSRFTGVFDRGEGYGER